MKTTDQLIEVLQKQVEIIESMIEALQFQQQAIIYYNLDGLHEGIARQNQLLEPIESLENERMQIVSSVLREQGIQKPGDPAVVVTLREIANHLSPDYAEKLEQLGDRIRDASEKVLELNRENDRLIENTQNFIHENVRILTENYSRRLIDQKI